MVPEGTMNARPQGGDFLVSSRSGISEAYLKYMVSSVIKNLSFATRGQPRTIVTDCYFSSLLDNPNHQLKSRLPMPGMGAFVSFWF